MTAGVAALRTSCICALVSVSFLHWFVFLLHLRVSGTDDSGPDTGDGLIQDGPENLTLSGQNRHFGFPLLRGVISRSGPSSCLSADTAKGTFKRVQLNHTGLLILFSDIYRILQIF